ncbi:ABC transporter PMR5 [Cryptococcus neoformans C23]|uniref:ABC transporter PMR5 n=2 Tax=Cryptococcus neoformans TaxID=5207 RepID=A0A854Q4J0_CRYNE|nr:ABC transporter PMR5 [Cryptococcus neoformans var. grubii H99]AUB28756.1 ABC transporter PMR5 [Cryptococcus neoformans var. grubii]OWZ26913.1 ABC transporter PMR5 [Cryptococcus neoformans var. grubii AD2-60a]OWZ38774.1 ABC transporter PMR5 [Cryptococcus neoformans var. grubii C23]OXG10729.1 ABC transporter PMR5 [Cryptococcus neoformans var. grubii Tu259-1]AFR98586.2 ABC transporter PMR5 [Cryptococcus neoformans var. grubii H99]|eukprot:XP_012053301.1 ABC transporter PMR5 [Cryptococcus neoformans var. grubii H99]
MTYHNDDPEATVVQSAASSSSPSLLAGEETNSSNVLKKDSTENVPMSHGKIFDQPGSIPLPNAGYHSLGVVWEDVTVYGAGGGKKYVESFEVSIFKLWDVYSFVKKLFRITTGPTRPLIRNFSGVAEEGEVLLVLGRPGAGCSTLMRALANVHEPFVKIEGDVSYSTIPAHEAKEYYDGEIIFNSEEDEHQPLLTVEETIKAALLLKEPHKKEDKEKRSEYLESLFTRILDTFGMPHTRNTKVGNQFVRGVSGGERKRVSLAEILTTNAAVTCWDNPIRGLDSAVALHFYKVLRELSKSLGMVNIISTYQTAQDAWDCVDRVVVIYEGRQIFSGRASRAQAYFESMGWYKKSRQTTPDFLTAVTSHNERKVRDGFKGQIPETPEEFEQYFLESQEYKDLQQDIQQYKERHAQSSNADEFQTAVKNSKHPGVGKSTSYRVNFAQQVAILCKRQLQLTRSDMTSLVYRLGSNVLQAVLVGAVCYKPPNNSAGSFAVAGALFFCILYYTIFALGEVPATVNSRPLLKKHRALGFYHPAAHTLAQIVCDIPIYVFQTLLFSAIFYFMVGLTVGANYFFTFWFVIFTMYEAISVMYRMIGSWTPNMSVAIRYGCLALSVVLTSSGFALPPPRQLRWISWLRRATPCSWAFEALLANEFRARILTCSSTDLIPSGPGYDDIRYQVCSINGAQPGSLNVAGMDYVNFVYGFEVSHVWRNVGILWAYFVVYVIMIIIGSSLLIRESPDSSQKVYKRGGKAVVMDPKKKAEEGKAAMEKVQGPKGLGGEVPVYTFEDVYYTVQVAGKDKPLLNGISGYVKGGSLTALMGASGAGKTTLLDTISLRKTTGKVEGKMTIDGKPLDASFSRQTGFAMQADIHEPMSTVRECLQFSALLRQSNDRTREERLEFAESIIKLLELEDIADALIGAPGEDGLGVEERKRVTIGVELAADPEFLLFLDEPTSGLDSQASYEIVRFLKRIAASGLAVLCTIHQPSGDLFEMFDSVVLLAPGGHTVYVGETGENAETVVKYFGDRGAYCPPEANPAEFILGTVAPVGGTDTNWPALWKQSDEATEVRRKINEYTLRNNSRSVDSEKAVIEVQPKSGSDAYASSFMTMTRELVIRNFRAQWRDGSFWTTQTVILVYFGLYVGCFYYKLDHTPNNMTPASLSLLVAVQALPGIAMDIGMNYLAKMDMFLARERLGIYSWQALVTSLLIVSLPILFVGWNLLFFCFYWTVGLIGTRVDGILVWLCFMSCSVLNAGFGILLGAVSPNRLSLPYILSLVWNLLNVLSWALVFYSGLPSPFHYFFSWLSPLRYLYSALMTAALGNLKLECIEDDLITFYPPSGQTCYEYAAKYLATTSGYLVDDNSTTICQYCASSTGYDYVQQMGYSHGTKWRDWAITIIWCLSNILFCFLFTWAVKIRPLYKKN